MTRSAYIKTLQEEYRTLNARKVEIQKRMDTIHEQLEKLKDEKAIAEASKSIYPDGYNKQRVLGENLLKEMAKEKK